MYFYKTSQNQKVKCATPNKMFAVIKERKRNNTPVVIATVNLNSLK